jgi:hypothetical protein
MSRSMAAKIGRDWRSLLDLLWSESEESREGLGVPLDLLVEWIDRLPRAKRAFGWSLSQVHVGTCTSGERRVLERERDLDIAPTYTTCDAPQYPCPSPYSLSGESILDVFVWQWGRTPQVVQRRAVQRKACKQRLHLRVNKCPAGQLGRKSQLVHLMPEHIRSESNLRINAR